MHPCWDDALWWKMGLSLNRLQRGILFPFIFLEMSDIYALFCLYPQLAKREENALKHFLEFSKSFWVIKIVFLDCHQGCLQDFFGLSYSQQTLKYFFPFFKLVAKWEPYCLGKHQVKMWRAFLLVYIFVRLVNFIHYIIAAENVFCVIYFQLIAINLINQEYIFQFHVIFFFSFLDLSELATSLSHTLGQYV